LTGVVPVSLSKTAVAFTKLRECPILLWTDLAMLLEGIDLSKLKRTPRYQRPHGTAEKIETESLHSGNAVSSADA
jgi:hypothetical protein